MCTSAMSRKTCQYMMSDVLHLQSVEAKILLAIRSANYNNYYITGVSTT